MRSLIGLADDIELVGTALLEVALDRVNNHSTKRLVFHQAEHFQSPMGFVFDLDGQSPH